VVVVVVVCEVVIQNTTDIYTNTTERERDREKERESELIVVDVLKAQSFDDISRNVYVIGREDSSLVAACSAPPVSVAPFRYDDGVAVSELELARLLPLEIEECFD